MGREGGVEREKMNNGRSSKLNFMNVQGQIKEYITYQTNPKGSDMQELPHHSALLNNGCFRLALFLFSSVKKEFRCSLTMKIVCNIFGH